MVKTIPQIRIISKDIPSMEKKLLCATFLESVIRFYENEDNKKAFKKWYAEKGEHAYGSKNSR